MDKSEIKRTHCILFARTVVLLVVVVENSTAEVRLIKNLQAFMWDLTSARTKQASCQLGIRRRIGRRAAAAAAGGGHEDARAGNSYTDRLTAQSGRVECWPVLDWRTEWWTTRRNDPLQSVEMTCVNCRLWTDADGSVPPSHPAETT